MAEDADLDLIDDSWDDLPSDALQNLEEFALQSTQYGRIVSRPEATVHDRQAVPRPSSTPLQRLTRQGEPSIDQQWGGLNAEGRHALNNLERANRANQNVGARSTAIQANYDAHVEKALEGRMQQQLTLSNQVAGQNKVTVTPSQGQQQKQLSTASNNRIRPPIALGRGQSQTGSVEAVETYQLTDSGSSVPGNHDSATFEALQIQMEELLRERDTLKQSLQQATSDAQAKAGEIAIVRENYARQIKEWEQKMAATERLHADEAAKKVAELIRIREEQKKMRNDNIFLQQDLTVEERRRKDLERNLGVEDVGLSVRTRPNTIASPVATPKKPRDWTRGEGFDDNEIMMISPSRSSGRKGGTPRAGAKRKRKALDDSPVPRLQLDQLPDEQRTSERPRQDNVIVRENISQRSSGRDSRYIFLEAMLNHRTQPDRPRTLEVFSKYSLPSKPTSSLASIFYDKLSQLSLGRNSKQYPVDFCEILLSIWSDCLTEKYYPPVGPLISLLTFALAHDTMSKAPHVVYDLIPVAQDTAEINARPRCKGPPGLVTQADINTSDCLNLLHLTALGCIHDDDAIKSLWKCMRIDFVGIMLNPNQQIEDISVMIELLRTSVLEESLGPYSTGDYSEQTINENFILDRLSAKLIQSPMAEDKDTKYDRSEIADLRIDTLELLGIICDTHHGGEAIAKHETIIGRLVRIINDELNSLYDYHDDHELCAKQVNLATRILYHLVTNFPGDVIRLQEKVAVIPGGTHKHLVGLTRLAFSEGLVQEAEIEDEVVEYARKLLEEEITPEEGEALRAAFTPAPR